MKNSGWRILGCTTGAKKSEAAPQSDERSRRLNAQRQKRHRRLIKEGLTRFAIVAPAEPIVSYLIGTGRIDEGAALNHRAVERALAALVRDAVERFEEGRSA